MCILCHYKGDSKLVTAEIRIKEHRDHQVPCVRDGVCYDCEKEAEYNHTCARPLKWIDTLCLNCGAEPGEKCYTKGFDQYGPRPVLRKANPCLKRKTSSRF